MSISLHDDKSKNVIKTILPSLVNFSSPSLDYSKELLLMDRSPPHSYKKDEPKEKSRPIEPLPKSDKKLDESNNEVGLAQDFDITWGDHRGKFKENGTLLTLSLDKYSGSGFQSKKEYLFAKVDIRIKLIPGNSAGTVTTFYMSSNETRTHDELDFEFLGNLSGKPYTIHTNIYTHGKGNREQQFYLWFDPTQDFHNYSILWNPSTIIFFVDGIPIREFRNMEAYGVPFPNGQPMRIFSSLWNADDWATQGGRVHTDWSKAPFVASYRDFSASACVWSFGSSSCRDFKDSWLREELDSIGLKKLIWVQENYMTYNYCDDKFRFLKEELPKECTIGGPAIRRRDERN